MLAVQKHDGDLRVWSVTKAYNIEDPAKVVRILRKAEALENGSNWMGWSKNGRVIQFSDRYALEKISKRCILLTKVAKLYPGMCAQSM